MPAAKPVKGAIRVVAAFYPLAEAASRVGGRYVRVQNLTPAGAEPHDLELSTDDRDAIQDARLVIVMGKGFQPGVEAAADERDAGTLKVLPALLAGEAEGTRVAPKRARSPPRLARPASSCRTSCGSSQRRARESRPPPRGGRSAPTRPPTTRRSPRSTPTTGPGSAPVLAICWSRSTRRSGISPKRYGLRQQGVVGLVARCGAEPERLDELIDLVEKDGVTTIFTETLVSPKIAETLAREAGGLKTEVLNPIEGLTDAQARKGDDYVSVMRSNLTKLRAALGCS